MDKKLKKIPSRPDIDKLEQEVLSFWRKNKIFEKSVNNRPKTKEYVFYDGPPFATGLPHYGHLLQGTIKDVVPRYWTMQGYRVERRFGWDCHGLPVEYELEKEKKIKTRQQIVDWGIGNFNEACRSIVTRYTNEWRAIVPRLGRWVDFDNDYKTMNPDYMESIWWVFKSLWDKDLIYEGYRPAHICPRCATPLSNFEVTLGYKDKQDTSVVVKFPVKNKPQTYLLAWTTTPWTLPGNMLLAVAEKTTYIKVKSGDDYYVLAKDRLEMIFDNQEYEIVEEIPSQKLIGLEYTPLYAPNNFEPPKAAYRVVEAGFVNLEDGTGIVHIAPAYGEDDFYLGQSLKLPILQHIGLIGQVDDKLYPQWAKTDVFQLNQKVVNDLDSRGLVFKQEDITHSYPHCWRCNTPLINYATKSWFVKVTKIKDQLIKANQQINWLPKHVKNGRFGKWLENARDWSISRNRFWGAPLPVWRGDKTGKVVVVGSRQELEKLSGRKVTDLHLHKISQITWQDKETQETMRLIGDVLDCWFESGSMPYASFHYPFENKTRFESHFPADFIAEGIEQARGWFYTLHVIANALFNRPAFKNCITTGIILAEDGQKMSKSKKNYPDPMAVVQKYGADALRFYLINSPLVKGKDLRFKDSDLAELKERLITTYWNSFKFYMTYANLHNFKPTEIGNYQSLTVMNRWILSRLWRFQEEVDKAMTSYQLDKATKVILEFTTDLSQWYIRRIRDDVAVWQKDKGLTNQTLNTLYQVLVYYSQISAPFIPFMTEYIYQALTGCESVHLTDWPSLDKTWNQPGLLSQMNLARQVVSLGHNQRKELKIKVRQPLSRAMVTTANKLGRDVLEVVAAELNLREIKQKSGQQLEIKLNTHISADLKQAGLARDLIRKIQNKRRQLGLSPKQKIAVFLPDWPKAYEEEIKTKTLAKTIDQADDLKVSPVD